MTQAVVMNQSRILDDYIYAHECSSKHYSTLPMHTKSLVSFILSRHHFHDASYFVFGAS